MIVYYSSASGNTERFVEKLNMPAIRLPQTRTQDIPTITQPFVLICPTYADGEGKGAVPKPVIHLLNQTAIRTLLVGVIASGNRNFGEFFAFAGSIISRKCNVPLLYQFELAGTPQDVKNVRHGLEKFWNHHGQNVQP
ncbi:class Ib ribonucleoside-diphosphate reductase assembly flavoprotein NrdI [Vibrio tritonius]|uniref:class Ib ribonucleoside-diphosphate reductase assembly flavoprotein NrdI n=1 Tax=Vibrio tritonius TaxID=1435069 RepID=UPI000838E4E8|nr:class Ib ribonucleoside-diphosphate reductase assembly flavoprotein NrdI [Vibrio tritonius]